MIFANYASQISLLLHLDRGRYFEDGRVYEAIEVESDADTNEEERHSEARASLHVAHSTRCRNAPSTIPSTMRCFGQLWFCARCVTFVSE